ncbi:IQ domain-containing protein M isoform X3 [Pelodiscus sinensis]|uniref:IQ domain-containing protein M isoform X3 n=1 Tax=Pelodiscus sinensis TaxID=13735 RepID=UPI000D71EEF0|nr:IQ domain-containing protein M isoform X3 [Pelodiscus sinensis]|eukprot:XP_025041281.1 IQ domain-containing protein M isoform X3 [Pelodiscus sinensis]
MDTTRTKFSFLEKGLEQPYERPYSANDSTSKCFKTYPERSKISVQSPPQCIMKEKETISLRELLTGIESMSRALKHKTSENYASASWAFNLPSVSTCVHDDIPSLQMQYKGKEYQDWRGVVTKKPSKVQKQVEQKSPIIKVSEKKKRTNSQDEKLKEAVTTTTIKPERKISSGKHVVFRTQEKVKRIGPHVEIFEAFHTKKDPSCKKVIKAAIYIQKYARGWLERARFKRIKTKAARHGPSLLAVVKEYRKMMNRIQRRAGVLNPSTPLKYSELEEWMDKKKFYETMFAKREFGKDMDKNDLQAFFKDCGKVLSRKEIDRMLHVVYPGFASEVKTIKKYHALELAFTIFPPAGSKQNTVAVSKSTWVQPIVDGIDGYGYLVVIKLADKRDAAVALKRD